jgi:hypothetical protein
MKLKELISRLQNKTAQQNNEVQFIICTKDGEIVMMELESKNGDIVKALSAFKGS